VSRLLFAVIAALVLTALVAFAVELGPGLVRYARENPEETALYILIGLLSGLGGRR